LLEGRCHVESMIPTFERAGARDQRQRQAIAEAGGTDRDDRIWREVGGSVHAAAILPGPYAARRGGRYERRSENGRCRSGVISFEADPRISVMARQGFALLLQHEPP